MSDDPGFMYFLSLIFIFSGILVALMPTFVQGPIGSPIPFILLGIFMAISGAFLLIYTYKRNN